MGYMKEKYTEAQEVLYDSYLKLLESRAILEASELKEDDILERYGVDLNILRNGMNYAIWLFEHSELYENFGLDILFEETYEGNVSETKENES